MSKRWFITGASGFVGGHLVESLATKGEKTFAFVLPKSSPLPKGCVRLTGDLLRPEEIRRALRFAAPTHVIHLAAIPAPVVCEKQPLQGWSVNVDGALNLLESVRETASGARCVLTSSGYVYRASEKALREDDPTGPETFYGLTKLTLEQLGWHYVQRGLSICIVRPFNLVGPGQAEGFLIPDIAGQIAAAEAGTGASQVRIGKLEVFRDFVDVRDAVEAFLAVARRGRSGEAYNLCSGKPRMVAELVRELIYLSKVPLELVEAKSKLRRSDPSRLVGSPAKILRHCGWSPRIPISHSLEDLLGECRGKLPAGRRHRRRIS